MAENTIARKVRDFDITLHTATASATTLDMRDGELKAKMCVEAAGQT